MNHWHWKWGWACGLGQSIWLRVALGAELGTELLGAGLGVTLGAGLGTWLGSRLRPGLGHTLKDRLGSVLTAVLGAVVGAMQRNFDCMHAPFLLLYCVSAKYKIVSRGSGGEIKF